MSYADYLKARSGDCIRLAVERPWTDDTGDLIDLARDYSSWAASVEQTAEMFEAPPVRTSLFRFPARH
jgi:hypothetical protein